MIKDKSKILHTKLKLNIGNGKTLSILEIDIDYLGVICTHMNFHVHVPVNRLLNLMSFIICKLL